MDMDRILVLRDGQIAELDSPKSLLKDKKGVLYGMVRATGKANAKHLIALAQGQEKIADVLRISQDIGEANLATSPRAVEKGMSTKKDKKVDRDLKSNAASKKERKK